MKTFGHLWEKVWNFESLYQAYKRSSKGKRYDETILRFTNNLEENLIDIQNKLIWKTWEPGRWHEFQIFDPKKRQISAPPFQDRIVHHSLVNVIEQLFERRFIYHSYACRVGKGTHAAVNRALALARKARFLWEDYWVLKCDIKSCFPSVDHNILKQLLRRTIKDKDVLWLCDIIIDSGGCCGKGLPIGALTSQLFANVYLDVLDHFLMDDMGIKAYCRYMDDFIILGPLKSEMKVLKNDINQFINSKLAMHLNERTAIFKWNQGIDFCGYRIWPTHVLPRKRNVARARRKLKKLSLKAQHSELYESAFRGCLASFHGYMKHCEGYVTTALIDNEVLLSQTPVSCNKAGSGRPYC